MTQIILDMGSGNTCQNNKNYVKKMYDELKKIDTRKHSITCKWQLFKEAGANIPLNRDIFDFAYKYGRELGYEVTSSVFDKESLDFLLQYEIPFIKIANNRSLDWLIGEIPRKIPICASYGTTIDINKHLSKNCLNKKVEIALMCVSKYPANVNDYGITFGKRLYDQLNTIGISDHTTDFELWHRFQPKIIEWHFVLEYDKNNLDGGLFARTPEQLQEVL